MSTALQINVSQVRSDVRRHGIGEISHFTTGCFAARDAGRTKGRGSKGSRYGMNVENDLHPDSVTLTFQRRALAKIQGTSFQGGEGMKFLEINYRASGYDSAGNSLGIPDREVTRYFFVGRQRTNWNRNSFYRRFWNNTAISRPGIRTNTP